MSTSRPSLSDLVQPNAFVSRHIGPRDEGIEEMLRTVGYRSLDALIDAVMPESIRSAEPAKIGDPLGEYDAVAKLREMASRNMAIRSYIGMGYYGAETPLVVQRKILENPAWYTAYTPYQAEISQGRLEALLNFQTMVSELTGMDLANASLLDEGTAAAEAMAVALRSSKSKSLVFIVDPDCHPQTIDVIRTRAEPIGVDVRVADPLEALDSVEAFGVLTQYPGCSGEIRDIGAIAQKAKAAKALTVVATDLLALTLLEPPGRLGADIAVGSSQRFGVPMGFGGPHAAFFATSDRYKRTMPGRLVGVSVDRAGAPALRLALQTREQHIRREKATSNVCTAQVLLAVIASMYAVYHGPEGLTRIGQRVHRLTAILAHALKRAGYEVLNDHFFDTLTIRHVGRAESVVWAALDRGVNLRRIDGDHVGVSLDETVRQSDVADILEAFDVFDADLDELDSAARDGLPPTLLRADEPLRHPIFKLHRSETDLLRYMRKLVNRDIALDRSMIPLGSCTMKLNATAEMEAVTWPEFGAIHPFVPRSQSRGYMHLIMDLEKKLEAITGFDRVSLQPNAGSQGEYAGLLAIRGYHRERGDADRTVCLIPSSAHGTNPASASMAGMSVVVVGCDEQGNVDVADLKAKAGEHKDRLAALMITYPSTHGVFEEAVCEICDIVHANGGQVYMDGANMNALCGYAKPAEIGADVCHLNLHKTFCIPHGGGGPGVGPIGVKSHLAAFLPGHFHLPDRIREGGVGPVSSAAWGSPSILPISWAYLAMMGSEGLRSATAVAILSANYIAARLRDSYGILYAGPGGLVAHECILDTRPLKDEAGVTVDDIAKRLMDYGFHAPTMSWPVTGTLMVEPTESEPKQELDRFCDAMIAIREEARKVASGEWPQDDNPLRNAPHTAAMVSADDWPHPYSRQVAAFPVGVNRSDKYWPPVGRIDNVHGDRNLVCSCPPLEAYREAAE